MFELTIDGKRLSVIGAELRALKAEAAKVVAEEMKKAKGLVVCIGMEDNLSNLSHYAARAYQHVKNAVAVSVAVGIPVVVLHGSSRYLHVLVLTHPLHRECAEMMQLAIALEISETNPANWAYAQLSPASEKS